MPVRKPTTTADVAPVEDATSAGGGDVMVVSPSGAKTLVPASLVEALLDSGYSKAK